MRMRILDVGMKKACRTLFYSNGQMQLFPIIKVKRIPRNIHFVL